MKLCLVLSLLISVAPFSGAWASPIEARRTLVSLAISDTRDASIEEVRRLVESYRIDSSRFMPLATAPYPRFLIGQKLDEIYPALYASTVRELVPDLSPEQLKDIPLVVLYDRILELIVKNQVPEAMKSQLSKLSPRMASQALKGRETACVLDESEKIESPSMISLVFLKIDFMDLIPPCTYRQAIYNAAKPHLIAAKKQFPEEFRKGFLEKINSTLAKFPQLIHRKFDVETTEEMHPIWSQGSIVEVTEDSPVSGNRRMLTMKAFAEGLLADLYAARTLIESSEARDRSLAAGLFYAVVNRWLMLTGGAAPEWDEAKKEMAIEKMNSGVEPPKFREARFGGWGVRSFGLGLIATSWNWGGYEPTREKDPSPLQIFPHRFEIAPSGVATIVDPADAFQTNEDFGLLLLSVAHFLRDTQPGTAFARFFGGADQVGDLLDEEKPMLFPTEGRLLAVGVLSAIAQNLLHPTIGHVGMRSSGMRIFFRDQGYLPSVGGIRTESIDSVAVSRMLIAGANLMRVLSVDPLMEIEPKLKSILPDVKNLVLLGGLVVAKASEAGFQGAFRAKLSSNDPSTTMDSQITTLRLLLAGYNESNPRSPFHAAWLVPGMSFLFSNLLSSDAAPLTSGQRLEVLAIWNDSQVALRAAHPELPWVEWEKKVRAL